MYLQKCGDQIVLLVVYCAQVFALILLSNYGLEVCLGCIFFDCECTILTCYSNEMPPTLSSNDASQIFIFLPFASQRVNFH